MLELSLHVKAPLSRDAFSSAKFLIHPERGEYVSGGAFLNLARK
jgi:hypothetical protein